MFKHGFWGMAGVALLVIGGGLLTLVGGLMGIPTILTYTNLAAAPNYLQSMQVVFLILGTTLLIAGLA